MLSIPELERRWKRYRRSKQIPYIVTGIIVSLLGAGVLIYLLIPASQTIGTAVYKAKTSSAALTETTAETKSLKTPPQLQAVQERSHPAVSSAPTVSSPAAPGAAQERSTLQAAASSQQPEPESPKPASAARTVKLAPSMTFMQDFESDVMQYYFEDSSSSASSEQRALPVRLAPETQPQPGLPAIRSHAVSSAPPSVVNVETVPPHAHPAPSAAPARSESKKMLIRRENDMKDIQDVIKRFKKNKNPALSLFVAKRYYRIGSYQEAYNYALMTNELDSNIEDSWLIFAKSLYKLDQKEMAIKTLKTYYDDSGSVKAKITLDQMKKGTLK